MRTLALFTALVCSGGVCTFAQDRDTAQQEDRKNNPETKEIYGKIKEVEDKKKIVIAIDNAPDKEYDLTDPKRTIEVAEALRIGDAVKVLETKNGRTLSVQIVRDTSRQQRSRTGNKDRR